MEFNLSDNPTFSELKNWFEFNRKELPKTLQSECIYYKDVNFTASKYIETLELRIAFCRENNIHPAKDILATTNKNQLFRLYKYLQILENWNKTLPKLNKFSNKMNQ